MSHPVEVEDLLQHGKRKYLVFSNGGFTIGWSIVLQKCSKNSEIGSKIYIVLYVFH